MEPVNQAWDVLAKVPVVLLQYEAYSKWLLLFLLAGGVLGLCALLAVKFKVKQESPTAQWLSCVFLVFVSTGGLYLQQMARHDLTLAHETFVKTHRFADGHVGFVVFDFNVPPDADADRRKRLLGHMPLLVHTVSDVLVDDLPDAFSVPLVLSVPATGPWQEVTQQNFVEIIERLNAVDIMWGAIYSNQARDMAKVSLGLRADPQHGLDTVIPLADVVLEEDPRAGNQFGDGRFQLLGAVTLAIALQTYGNAQRAPADQRKQLYLKAANQIGQARDALNSRKDDPALRRTLYSEKVTALQASALKEAGVQP